VITVVAMLSDNDILLQLDQLATHAIWMGTVHLACAFLSNGLWLDAWCAMWWSRHCYRTSFARQMIFMSLSSVKYLVCYRF